MINHLSARLSLSGVMREDAGTVQSHGNVIRDGDGRCEVRIVLAMTQPRRGLKCYEPDLYVMGKYLSNHLINPRRSLITTLTTLVELCSRATHINDQYSRCDISDIAAKVWALFGFDG